MSLSYKYRAIFCASMFFVSINSVCANEKSFDPDGIKLSEQLIPVYEILAHNKMYSMPNAKIFGEGKPITGLMRDDICGCHFSGSGSAVNAIHCEPIMKNDNEGMARVGVVRVIDYDTLRRSVFPSEYRNGEMAVSGLLRKSDRASRDNYQRAMSKILGDPHLTLMAPLPVSERLMGSSIAKVDGGRILWEMCDVIVGDRNYSPPERLSGFVARALLYAAKQYNVDVGYPLGTLVKVSRDYPPTFWEIYRNTLIKKYFPKYNYNSYINLPADIQEKK